MSIKTNSNLMSFMPQAVIESRYDAENPIHRMYLYLFCEQGRISRVDYKDGINVDIIVKLKFGDEESDLIMRVKIPK